MWREALTYGTIAGVAVACGSGHGPGVVSDSGCIETTTIHTLKDGDKLLVGIEDIGISSNGNMNNVTAIALEGSQVVISGTTNEASTLTTNGVVTVVESKNDEIAVDIDGGSVAGSIVEEGFTVDFELSRAEGDDTVALSLGWTCIEAEEE